MRHRVSPAPVHRRLTLRRARRCACGGRSRHLQEPGPKLSSSDRVDETTISPIVPLFFCGEMRSRRLTAWTDDSPPHFEETDWQRKVRRRGCEIRVATVDATHEGGGRGSDPAFRETHLYASAELYIRKRHGSFGWQFYRSGTFAGAALRSLLLRGDRRQEARRRRNLFARGPVESLSRLS